MGQQFIDKVRALVLNNLSNEKFGASELASELGLSKSQTLRKIKAATGKSANQYIRELRLEKAAKLIKKTDTSISEIAYKVGFGSATYFNTTFSKYYGIAPGEYKTKSANLNELKANKTNAKKINVFSSKTFVYGFLAVLFVVVGYFIINAIQSKHKSLPNSIAVLPFKDLSPQDNQWFSDGISDNILHALAQMKDVSVTSFTSSSTYRETDKKIPQIAKELGVSYVLEGSVILVDDEIKIITQLIDANDQHVWSEEYSDNFNKVISIQNNVAEEVIKQLKNTLNTQEEVVLKKYPTDNMEAYHLHLEGRLINQSRKWEDLQKHIEYNKKAIALDSSFADAYAEVASSNLKIAIDYSLSGNNTRVVESQYYVDKALSIDPNSAKANAVRARLALGNDWNDSETYFKKAIALNPNDAETQFWYADYFLKIDNVNLKQALKHATIAIKLSPFSKVIATKYAWILILNEEYDKADLFLEEYGFLMRNSDLSWLKIISLGFRNKSWQPTNVLVEKSIRQDPDNAAKWYIVISEGYEYGSNGDKNIIKAKEYAKKAYELDASYIGLYFEFLTSHGFFDEAQQVMQTDFFKNLPNPSKTWFNWKLHYFKKEYKKALDLADEIPQIVRYESLSKTYAQLGKREKIDSLNKIYFVHGEFKYIQKAYVHAILKERDSMYYYLNKVYSFRNGLPTIIGNPEFEPYKNDKRYKALLREWFIPIPGE